MSSERLLQKLDIRQQDADHVYLTQLFLIQATLRLYYEASRGSRDMSVRSLIRL